ncbi:MAG: STAS domain-containing protein [Planctomycetes bacterium]|nr:STAS domain-containing protein [Planctomycetota bacterium]
MSDKLSFDIQELPQVPGSVLVSMSGAIDASTVITFQTNLENLQLNGISKFILNMEGIRYVNSTGLGSLVRLADQLESDGGGFALVKIHPKVKVVFDMLGLNAFFKIFNSEEEAISFFSNGKVEASAPRQSTRQVSAPPPPPPSAPAPAQGTQMRRTPPSQQASRPADTRTQKPVFQPRAISCQNCNVTLKISQPGTFKCSRCYTVFTVQPTGQIQFQKQQQKASPLQMNLNCQNETKEALLWFLAAIAKYHSFTPQRTQVLQNCINEIVTHISRDAYNGNPTSTYSVLIAAVNNEINLKFADHGRTFPANAQNMFQYNKQNMRVFDLKPHPQSGNIITLKMTAF